MRSLLRAVRKLLFRTAGRRTEGQDVMPELTAEPMRRWSQEELSEVRIALETKSTGNSAKEDSYLAIDYLAQRYLPADYLFSESEWQAARARLRGKVDANLEEIAMGSKDRPLWELQNEEYEARQRVLSAPYGMQLKEFSEIIVPVMSRFPFAPSLTALNSEVVKNLWLATAPVWADVDWESKYAARDAKDALCGRFHPAILESCCMLRRTYEDLRRAKAAGCIEVKALARRRCGCLSTVDGKYMTTDAALDAFDVTTDGDWLKQLVDGRCAQDEDPRMCDISFNAIEPLTTGEGPEFAAWLRDVLRAKRP